MTVPKFFRLNQYNWFGQKLLVQQRYDDLLNLRQTLSTKVGSSYFTGELMVDSDESPLSDHMIYITGLALMKTSTRLDELIYTLQKLNFQKNGQYFLLLCQCLLYLGNHDAVVALCKQILNKEIDALPTLSRQVLIKDGDEPGSLSNETSLINDESSESIVGNGKENDELKQGWCLQQIYEESIEFKNIFGRVNENSLINDPRLWFIFALSLEFQLQYSDADLAHRVACKLAAGQARQISANRHQQESKSNVNSILIDEHKTSEHSTSSIGISNYCMPHKYYSEFCIRYRADYRTTMQILSQAAQISPPIDYTLNPTLALTLCSQANSNVSHFSKALEMINTLDNHSVSLRNPSFVYNQLALKCKQKLYQHNVIKQNANYDYLERICDERRYDLDYGLIKSHIVINDIVQNSSHNPNLYKCPKSNVASMNVSTKNLIKLDQMIAQIDKTLEALRRSNSNCWASPALWNNLGVCYLLKRRYIASLSCLIKAHQLNPIDWRINYNLSLVSMHVGLPFKALCCSLASRNFRSSQIKSLHALGYSFDKSNDLVTSTMIAVSYSELSFNIEARRFYAETIALGQNDSLSKTPILALVNYLLLLYQENLRSEKKGEHDTKAISRLLDLIEQAWLQRTPNDSQFAPSILEFANQISEILHRNKDQMKKTYAWNKFE
jgi:tetratricopeptide (TPR) repeat protein